MDRGDEAVLGLARSLLSAGTPSDLLRQLATAVLQATEADWAGVWTYDRREKVFSLAIAIPDGIMAPDVEKAGRKGDLLSEAVARGELIQRRGDEIREGMTRHLGLPEGRPVEEIACVPFTLDADHLGILEVARQRPSPAESAPARIRFLSACAALAASAAASMVQVEAGRERQMAAINRLMQLYDVSQAFHRTLERDALLPIIAGRIAMILEASSCRIWLPVEGGAELECAFPPGEGAPERLAAGSGAPGTAFLSGEAVLIADLADVEPPPGGEAAGGEEAGDGGEAAGSLVCAPLTADESRLGAIEVKRPPGAAPYGPDDRDFLEELARQAAIALRNANLLLAERKAKELDALLEVSREITSTLDLDRVLLTIVNRADSIVPSDRCAILLADGGRPELRAVSGQMEVDRGDPRQHDLEEILTWAYMGGQGLYVSELDGAIETDREETREKFRRYFERSGMKTFVAFPLRDEEGLLGMLSLESSQPYFVAAEKLEICNILANQATVAIRNASLYRQIPLLSFMKPLAGWRARLKNIPRWKRLRNLAAAAGAALALVLVPWNMKIAGKAVVLPARNSSVAAEVEGIVDAVYHREGDRVFKGDPLASLLDRDYRIRMEEAKARLEIADQEVARSDADHDPSLARQARIRSDQLREEHEMLRREMEKTRLLAPVDGVVLTPRLEQKAGSFLRRGEVFCQIADMTDVAVEVLVPETEAGEVREGQRMRLKIDSFPTRVLAGTVEIVGQKVIEEGGGRFLVARGRIDGADLPLRTGMLGRARIEAGRRSVGYVLLRKPARFLWRTIWAWMP